MDIELLLFFLIPLGKTLFLFIFLCLTNPGLLAFIFSHRRGWSFVLPILAVFVWGMALGIVFVVAFMALFFFLLLFVSDSLPFLPFFLPLFFGLMAIVEVRWLRDQLSLLIEPPLLVRYLWLTNAALYVIIQFWAGWV